MSRIALIVGIDDYPDSPLSGCVDDAESVAALLATNDDGSPNFQCRTLISSGDVVTARTLRGALRELFSKETAEISVFYFAGHGARERLGGYLVTQDADADDLGVRMEEVIGLANSAPGRERVIVLDCCHAGAVSELLATQGTVPLAEGVSILAACGRGEVSEERGGRGLFTKLLCDALAGGAANASGRISVAALYAYVDDVLTGWEQRPTFHTNVSRLTKVRQAAPAVKIEILRRLTTYFPAEDYELQLSPEFEPEANPHDEGKEKVFWELQQLRAARLVEPVGAEHMYYAAIQSKSCRLTPRGRFYWRCVKSGQL